MAALRSKGKGSPATALCIAGSARTFYLPEVYSYLRVEVKEALAADAFVVISLPDNATAQHDERWIDLPAPPRVHLPRPSSWSELLELPLSVIDPVDVLLLPPHGDSRMDAARQCVKAQSVSAVPRRCANGQDTPPAITYGLLGLVATASCFRMVQRHEKHRQQQYRHLVRVRPDAIYLWSASFSAGGMRGLRKRFEGAPPERAPTFFGCADTGGSRAGNIPFRRMARYKMSDLREQCFTDNVFALSRAAAQLFFDDELMQTQAMEPAGCRDWWYQRNTVADELLMPHLPWCGRFTECLVTLLVTRSNLTFETWCPVERFMRSCAEETGARRTCDKVPASCASAVMACGAREEEKSLDIECVHRGSPAGKCLVSRCRKYSYNALHGAGRDSDG